MATDQQRLAAGKHPYMARNHFNSATFTIGDETGGDTRKITVQLKTAGNALPAARANVIGYLSTDAEGDNIVSSAPSGGVAIATHGVAIPLVSGKAFLFISNATGLFDFNIIESGAANYYFHLCMPDGTLVSSTVIAMAG